MKNVTKRQHEVILFIQDHLKAHGYPPTIREIGSHFSFSVKAAFDHVKALEKKGILRCNENRSRAIEIIHEAYLPKDEGLDIPLLGNVAAGVPLLSEENFDRMIKVPKQMLADTGQYYALLVKGESMHDAGIFDGDIAVIKYQQQADNGDIVVARVQDEAVTLKRFFRENNRVRLQAENEEYLPLYTQEVQILGKLQMIIRDYT